MRRINTDVVRMIAKRMSETLNATSKDKRPGLQLSAEEADLISSATSCLCDVAHELDNSREAVAESRRLRTENTAYLQCLARCADAMAHQILREFCGGKDEESPADLLSKLLVKAIPLQDFLRGNGEAESEAPPTEQPAAQPTA